MTCGALSHSAAYLAVAAKLSRGDCIVTDGGVSTELEKVRIQSELAREIRWGFWALHEAQNEVLTVHRRYADTGCDVLTTNTWSVLDALGRDPTPAGRNSWELATTSAVRLARAAILASERSEPPALAFSLNGDVNSLAVGALELLTWKWLEEPPDLVVFETLTRVPNADLLQAVEMVSEIGLPVWVSLRHRADAGGSAVAVGSGLPSALRALESAGASALLINCIPFDLARDSLEQLVSAARVPVGCRPNLGHGQIDGWTPSDSVAPQRYADAALEWWESGARIVGGCCGVGPDHIAATVAAVRSAPAWSSRGV